LWADRTFLREVQYQTDANLAARQSIYAYQQPPVNLIGRVLDLAAPAGAEIVADIGCGAHQHRPRSAAADTRAGQPRLGRDAAWPRVRLRDQA
jgi:hypothetical protein